MAASTPGTAAMMGPNVGIMFNSAMISPKTKAPGSPTAHSTSHTSAPVASELASWP